MTVGEVAGEVGIMCDPTGNAHAHRCPDEDFAKSPIRDLPAPRRSRLVGIQSSPEKSAANQAPTSPPDRPRPRPRSRLRPTRHLPQRSLRQPISQHPRADRRRCAGSSAHPRKRSKVSAVPASVQPTSGLLRLTPWPACARRLKAQALRPSARVKSLRSSDFGPDFLKNGLSR